MRVYRVQSGDTWLCMESGVAFTPLRGMRDIANAGDAAFDEIMQT